MSTPTPTPTPTPASPYPQVAIIGCGASGVTAALRLREQCGIETFTIFERNGGPGGVWLENTYPGAACDVPAHYYSSATTLNPSWSSHYSGRAEIQAYWAKLHAEQGLAAHTRYHLECTSAVWSDARSQWTLSFRNVLNGERLDFVADIVLAAIGGFSLPNMQTSSLPGLGAFRGPVFHTARWDHAANLQGKRIGVIGNGCSAAQLVPALSQDAQATVINFVRSPQWYMPRDNRPFAEWTKWCYRNVPFANRLARWKLLLMIDLLSPLFHNKNGAKLRSKVEAISTAHIKQHAPAKYLDFLIPKFPLGAKRIIYDPGYLDALHRANVELVYRAQIARVTEAGVELTNGEQCPLDAIVLATGFDTCTFLTSIDVRGRGGADLKSVWDACGGPEAYYCSLVPRFPNLYMLGGPNSATGHQSVIFFMECQARWCCKVIARQLSLRASAVEPTPAASERYNTWLQQELRDTVWASDSTQSWYRMPGPGGKLHTLWPKSALSFYWTMMWPRWAEMDFVGKHGAGTSTRTSKSKALAWTALVAAVVGGAVYRFGLRV